MKTQKCFGVVLGLTLLGMLSGAAVFAYDVAGKEAVKSTRASDTTLAQIGNVWCVATNGADNADCNSSSSQNGIIFEDNFDNTPDWSSSPNYGVGETTGDILPYTDYRTCTNNCPPQGWTSYRSVNWIGVPTYQINSNNARVGSGKALTVTYENVSYISGGALDKWIGDPSGSGGGYDEIYIRWYEKLQPNFIWQSETNNLLKILRILIGADLNNMNWQVMQQYTNTTT